MTKDINKFYLAQTDVETMKIMSNYMTQMAELVEQIKLYSYNPNLAQKEINLINLMCLQVRQYNPNFNLPIHPGF
ncbi:hypothetical protein FNW02_32670 [Komarekiella sp. 'clone 1']|uniref:Uncharacterized protein n=1 Tax=Komarekiella delphini-convector SJRDD-AB1 TaxID=2593771 RepID=A0AA40T3S1_9NOST|nr:hypothetical protein [Komarekiella delphini-convector]MBD6620411.1 hypothetical protein [Komarekiella delphini-convector SJRDD-AB1]